MSQTPPPIPLPERIYRAGTLKYTTRGLIGLLAVLLLGDFCSTVFEAIFGPFMPLYLKQFDASNSFIALITGSTAGLMNLLFLPHIGMWSDRTRTRLGRRIPFLIWSAPLTAASLMLIAFAPDLAGWLQHLGIAPKTTALSSITLGTLTIFIIFWHFFNMVLLNVFSFLQRDVVPLELMPHFIAWFRLVGAGGHLFFQWYLYEHMMDHSKLLFFGVSVLFLASFALICIFVKEGDYPPPPPAASPNVFKTFGGYFRDCLSLSIYRNYFIAFSLILLGSVPVNTFTTLFARETLGLDLKTMGHVTFWSTLLSAILYIPSGFLIKKVSPFRIALIALFVSAAMRLAGYFLIQGDTSWLAYSVIAVFPGVAWAIGSASLTMFLFPAERFGQFSSGLNAIGYGTLIFTGVLVGQLMDYLGSNYRMIFMVSFACYAAAIVPMYFVYLGWKRHGGPDNYVPPNPS